MSSTVLNQTAIVNDILQKKKLLEKLLPYILSKKHSENQFEMLNSLNALAGKISPTAQNSDQLNNNINKSSANNNNNVHNNNNNNNNVHGVHPYSKPSPPRRSPTPATNAAASLQMTPDATAKAVDTSIMNGKINGLVNGGSNGYVEQPDPDFIKMFVGQIPRSMEEDQLREMFEEYGRVHQINVLRDKVTGLSKGCCFVTFITRKAALDAQNAMHNIKILTGMHHPIQMKPADSENRNERKLFVGMLAKKCTESDVRNLFSPYGTIEECTVLRDTNGQSKGCAFVTYASKQSAINAIKVMHHSQTMDGCSSALVVKFADTQKEKDQKRLQQMQANLWNLAGVGLSPPQYLTGDSHCLAPASVQLLQQLAGGGSTPTPAPASVAPSIASLHQQLLMQSALHSSPSLQSLGLGSTTNASSDISSANLQNLATLANLSVASQAVNPMSVQNLVTLAAIQGSNGTSLQVSPNALSSLTATSAGVGSLGGGTAGGSPLSPVTLGSPMASFASHNGTSMDALTSAYHSYAGFGTSSLPSVSSGAGKQIEGPDGANLFIYHLPQEFSDNDLATTFHSFGNVISAKVFIDKMTNLSKCFGFVSYDNALSAQSAIQAMNGFQIGTKRLKVQLKRSKEASRPY